MEGGWRGGVEVNSCLRKEEEEKGEMVGLGGLSTELID